MDNKVVGKVNRPLCYMDHNNNFDNRQVEKINSMIKNQYNRFTDKTFQEQEREGSLVNSVAANSILCNNITSFEYNGIGFANFQFILFITERNTDYKIFECNHEIEGDIMFSGSSSNTMFDSISDYGEFRASGKNIYFRLIYDPPQLLYPWVSLTWRYK